MLILHEKVCVGRGGGEVTKWTPRTKVIKTIDVSMDIYCLITGVRTEYKTANFGETVTFTTYYQGSAFSTDHLFIIFGRSLIFFPI